MPGTIFSDWAAYVAFHFPFRWTCRRWDSFQRHGITRRPLCVTSAARCAKSCASGATLDLGGPWSRTPLRPPRRASISTPSLRSKRMKIAFLAALAAALGITGIGNSAAVAETAYTPPALRVPDGSRPTRYELTLTVVPGEAKANGEITIDVELTR